MKQDFGRQRIPRLPVHPDRKALVVQRCRGLRVLHVGCADAPYTAERLGTGELLHARIRAVAGDLWGLDLDRDAVAFLEDAGFSKLLVADLCMAESLDPIRTETFDLIVATEVLEHLLCPGAALRNLASLMVPGQSRLLVTLPNAYRIDTLLGLLRGEEFVHPDHNAWYSWYTASHLLEKSGLSVVESGFYSHHRPGLVPSLLARPVRAVRDRLQVLVRPFAMARLDDKDSGMFSGPASVNVAEHDGDSWAARLRGYLAGLPPRLVVTLLARRPALWADGVYLVAESSGSGESGA